MGSRPGDEAVKLGDWSRGNEYSHSIIEVYLGERAISHNSASKKQHDALLDNRLLFTH